MTRRALHQVGVRQSRAEVVILLDQQDSHLLPVIAMVRDRGITRRVLMMMAGCLRRLRQDQQRGLAAGRAREAALLCPPTDAAAPASIA